MRVALVYDRLNKMGGAEQVLVAFHELFPDADWYTSFYDPVATPFIIMKIVYVFFFYSVEFIGGGV